MAGAYFGERGRDRTGFGTPTPDVSAEDIPNIVERQISG